MQGGIEKVPHLRVLYMSNNKLKDWAELDKLTALVDLEVPAPAPFRPHTQASRNPPAFTVANASAAYVCI